MELEESKLLTSASDMLNGASCDMRRAASRMNDETKQTEHRKFEEKRKVLTRLSWTGVLGPSLLLLVFGGNMYVLRSQKVQSLPELGKKGKPTLQVGD